MSFVTLHYYLILLALCTFSAPLFSQSTFPPDSAPESITIQLNRRAPTTIPSLQPGYRHLLRVNALTPTRSLQDRNDYPTDNSVLVVDLISPYGMPILLSAEQDQPPAPCNVTQIPLPQSCFSERGVVDTYALYTRSSRAFLTMGSVSAITRVVLSVQNAGIVESPVMTIHIARLSIISDSDPGLGSTGGHSLCPGSAAGARCSNQGTCETETSQCQCNKGLGGRACETTIRTIPPAQARPSWEGEIPAAQDSGLLYVPLTGTVLRVVQSGSPSYISFSARILDGSVSKDGDLLTLGDAKIAISTICKMRGEDRGVTPTVQPAPDIPAPYDVNARATLVQMPDSDVMVYELVCVSNRKISKDDNWLVAFMVDDRFGVPEGANTTVFSVRSMRCGEKDLSECPLGVETDKQSLWKWVLIGCCIAIATGLIMSVTLWICGCTIEGIRQNQTGGVIDGRIYQVVDDEDHQTKRRQKLKGEDFEDSGLEMMGVSAELYAYDTSDTVDMTDDGDDESRRRRVDPEKANWEKVWTAERERRRMRLLEEDVTSRPRRDVGSSSDRSLRLQSAWPNGAHLDMPVEMEMNK